MTCQCNRFMPRLATIILAASVGACAGTLKPIESPAETTPPPSADAQWQRLASARSGDWFKLLNSGSAAFDWRLRAIDSAAESIDVQTFIWELDEVGHAVRDHLLAAAERGVFVRVLVDDSFVLDADAELLAIDQHPGIELKVYNPYKRRSSHAALRQVLNAGEFHRLDHRMHNKVMVVDNRVAIIGGRNIAEHYFGYGEQDNFRDMELVAGGPVVEDLAGGFDRYWNSGWSFPVAAILAQRAGPGTPEPAPVGAAGQDWHAEQPAAERQRAWLALAESAASGSARLLIDRPPELNPAAEGDRPVQVGNELVQVIDRARSELWLVSAYLVPTDAFEAALRRATGRGVRVRILTNSINSNNHLTAHSAYRRHMQDLVRMGVELHELRADAADRHLYMESPVEEKSLCLHAKLMVIDDASVFIGSANFDPRSLVINTEMGLLIEGGQLNQDLRQALEPDFSPRNAWQVMLDESGRLTWVSDTEVLHHQPTHSFMRRIEDWFLSLVPLESEM